MKLLIIAALCLGAAQAYTYTQAVFPKDMPDFARIVGGQPATTGQFPWQVAILMTLGIGQGWCGGSIISPDWVLTAAHCAVNVLRFDVRIGSTLLNVPQVTLVSTQATVHPNYNPSNLNNDIALIRLPTSLGLGSNTIQSIRLATRTHAAATLAGLVATVSGFGRVSDSSNAVSPTLQHTNVTIITNAACAAVYQAGIVIASTVCARGTQQSWHSTCNGDSGGPLVIYEGLARVPYQIGVVSFVSGRGCASGDPSGYVRTGSFLSWINTHTGIPIVN